MNEPISPVDSIKELLKAHVAEDAAIKTLLERHMTESGERERSAVARASEDRAAVKNLASSVAEFGQRLTRVEVEREHTHSIARKALESGHELEGVVLREVAALQTSNTSQNKALEAIQISTKGIVEADAERKRKGAARDELFALIADYAEKTFRWTKGIAAALIAVTVIAGTIWAIFTFAVKQAERPASATISAPAK